MRETRARKAAMATEVRLLTCGTGGGRAEENGQCGRAGNQWVKEGREVGQAGGGKRGLHSGGAGWGSGGRVEDVNKRFLHTKGADSTGMARGPVAPRGKPGGLARSVQHQRLRNGLTMRTAPTERLQDGRLLLRSSSRGGRGGEGQKNCVACQGGGRKERLRLAHPRTESRTGVVGLEWFARTARRRAARETLRRRSCRRKGRKTSVCSLGAREQRESRMMGGPPVGKRKGLALGATGGWGRVYTVRLVERSTFWCLGFHVQTQRVPGTAPSPIGAGRGEKIFAGCLGEGERPRSLASADFHFFSFSHPLFLFFPLPSVRA